MTATARSDHGTMQDDGSITLAALVTRVREGHPDAQTEFYRHLHPRFMAIAARIFGNWNDAEDAVHEAFIALLPQIGRIDLGNNPQAYCDVICRNKCLTLIRRAARRGRREFASGNAEHLGAEMPDSLQSDETEYAFQLWHEVLALADDATQGIIRLRFVDNLTYHEIAAKIGMSTGGVHKALGRFLEQMRQRFSERDD